MTPFDCPRCAATLTMTERHGIEIDYCPQCRGVWLDRGELDKIIERAGPAGFAAPAAPTGGTPAGGWTQPAAAAPQSIPGHAAPVHAAPAPQYRPRHDDDDWDGWKKAARHHGHGHKRKNWLSELFD